MADNALPSGFQLDQAPAEPQGDVPKGFQLDAEDGDQAAVDKYLKFQETHGGVGQQIKAGLEGAASAATFGLSTGAETALGVDPEDIRARREANPAAHAAGQIAGLIGTSLVPGLGEANAAKVMGAAGKLGAKAVGLGAAEGILAKGAQGAVTAAIENSLFQAGDEVSKMFAGNPSESVGMNIAESGLLGGVLGGAFGAASPLWKATVGERGGQFIEDFKSRVNEHRSNPNPGESLTKELDDLYHGTKSAADEVYGPTGLKSQESQKLMPEMSPKISAQADELVLAAEKSIEKLGDDPLAKKLAQKLEDFKSSFAGEVDPATGIRKSTATPGEIFEAAQGFKQELQAWSKFNKNIPPPIAEREFVRVAKDLSHTFRTALEDSGVWGKAAERQGIINKAFTEYLPALKNFESKFTTEIAGERVIDPGKVATYVNQSGKMSGAVKREMLGNFIEAAEKYKNVIGESHANLGIESPIQRSSLTSAKSSLQELTPGAKLADALVKKGLANLSGDVLGAGVGGAIGSTVGGPGIGAIIGQHALGPFISSILPAIAKPLLENPASAAALKESVDYGLKVIKGEAAAVRAAREVFKAGTKISGRREVSENDRQKLDKKLLAYKENPLLLMNVGGDTAHYLPDHAVAIAETAARSVNYLNSLRPDLDKKMPLDAKPKENPVQRAAFDRALNIAESPLSILDHVKEGTLLPQDLVTLNNVAPGLYVRLKQKVMDEMVSHISKEDDVPYRTRMGVSMFLGQPLDSTMTPEGIQALQAARMPAQQPQQMAQGNSPSATSMQKLSKIGAESATPGQMRQMGRAKHLS
jgi:hypothetical protein